MIPRADPQRGPAAYDIGYDVENVELAPVGQEGLQELRGDAEEGGDEKKSDIESAPARGVEDPIEG